MLLFYSPDASGKERSSLHPTSADEAMGATLPDLARSCMRSPMWCGIYSSTTTLLRTG